MADASGLVFEAAFLDHEIEAGHPESPGRLRAVARKLAETGLRKHFVPIAPLPDPFAALAEVHSAAHIRAIMDIPVTGAVAALAAGGAVAAVDAVCTGLVRNAFCAVRPPGHHAHDLGEEEGFCYYNNVAVAARHAQRKHGCSRVLIIDWDYHHGNGTEEAFYRDPSVLFFSTHKWMAYPGTGNPARQGEGEGLGFNINVDLGKGATDKDILLAWEKRLLPVAEAFRPDLVLISAGFDSRKDDYLGDFRIEDDAFRRMTRMAAQLASIAGGGKVVSLLEGGYNPQGLALGVTAHLEELLAVSGKRNAF
ncbi:MAG TPA: histone deacetylase [Fibrobacteria bacterium]|nr:histone deacetylase [Fibrobacteria bacterium]